LVGVALHDRRQPERAFEIGSQLKEGAP
jgi:hypothetical protein